jgi:hypothetical protein
VKIAESEQIPAYEFALEALSLAQELLLVSSSPYIEHKIHMLNYGNGITILSSWQVWAFNFQNLIEFKLRLIF